MSKRILVVISTVVVVVVGAGAFLLWPRGTSEVKPEQALKKFRERQNTTTTHPDHNATSGERSTPSPGVYSYAATGTEVVKLGPLPEENRPLPETVTAVAVDDGDGCFDFTINFFAEHTEENRWCVDQGALRWASHKKHQKIGALSPTANITCDPNVIRTPDAKPQPLECALELTGGPVPVRTSLTGGTTVGEATSVEVGGEAVEAVPVTLDFDVVGTVSGKWVEVIWWGPENLPVKVERHFDLSGPVRFKEETTLALRSLTPAA